MPGATLQDEKDLLLRLIKGDAEAFRKIYEFYQGRIFVFALRFTKSKAAAEEAVQEVFIKLWEKREQLSTDKNFNAWIISITKNLLIDGLKSAARDKKVQEKLYNNMQALRDSSIDQLLEKELHRLHQQAVDSLSPKRKQLYLLSREEELSYDQIAERLGIPKNTVRNQLSIALQTIRDYLKDHPDIALVILAYIIHGEK